MANKDIEKEDFSYKKLYLPLISGILTALGFYTTHLDFLIWVSLIPLFYSLFNFKVSKRQGFSITFVYSFSFYLGLLTWLFKLHPLTWVGFTELQSLLIITSGWIAFSLIESLSLSLLGILYGAFKPAGFKKISFVVSLWILIEFLQGLSEFGFTWGRLAISQYKELHLIQSANIFGSLFTSLLLVLVNASISMVISEYKQNNNKISFKYLYPAITLLLLNLGYGFYYINTKTDEGKEINTAIIQGNILSDQKWNMTVQQGIDIYLSESKKAITENKNEKFDLVVWPESAVRDVMDRSYIISQLRNFTSQNNTYLITGSFDLKRLPRNEYQVFNSMSGISPTGEVLGKYYKRHLVPFGEYLPFKDLIMKVIPALSKMNALKTDITAGTSTNVFSLPFGKIGGLICYESIFPELIKESVNDGAELLVLVTNDSWYKDSPAVYHHNGQAVFRSIENDRYMVRAANTGISSFVSPTGETIKHLDPLVKGYITAKVKFRNTKTVYSRIGDSIVFLGLLGLIFSIFYKKPE